MNYQFENLVFEGGGVKGIAYGGALELLEAKGIMPQIKQTSGASAGAIAALLVGLAAARRTSLKFCRRWILKIPRL